MGILLKNGQHVTENGDLSPLEIYIENGKIEAMAPSLSGDWEPKAKRVIDARGKLIAPGLVDMHVHLREPGFEKKETIETGTKAAARGGFTTVACMPNTRPVTDSPEIVRQVKQRAEEAGYARVLPLGAITVRELGKELTDFAALKEAGVVALSDDGVGVQSSAMMKEAMRRAKELDLPIVAHCEDDALIGGAVHEGVFSQKYGIKGIPSEAESIHVGRDCLLAEATGVHYHVCHISTKQSVRLVRLAKEHGVRVTAEVTPHHLLLCDEDIPGPDPNYKMNPPLRSQDDREALLEGIKDGTIDFIATDHAPHTAEEKSGDIQRAPFGIVGLETAFPLLYTKLVLNGFFSLKELLDRMTAIPAERFKLPYGVLKPGAAADITVIDLELEKAIDPNDFVSKGKNTPFTGWKCKGWPVLTIQNGDIVWDSNEKGRDA